MANLNCLVLMPFAEEFDPVFRTVQTAVQDALPDRAISCEWLKHVHAAGCITDDIVSGIEQASLCVADLTTNNPNVMWETGYAMAAGKPTILICQHVDALPFDLKVHRVLEYEHTDVSVLVPTLAEAVRQTVSRHSIASVTHAEAHSVTSAPVIAVTGSTSVHQGRARRRIESLLQPYLAMNALWYCGSYGDADELAIEWLMENGQSVVAVGYNQFDYSTEVRKAIDVGRLPFLDASVESVPRGLSGPSERDTFFAAKADLVVLIWDGTSGGTGLLVDYYKKNAKSLLIGFV